MSLALPKPPRRGPKPRRPIRRGKGINPFKRYGKLLALCDDTFSLYIRLRDRNCCRLCGDDGQRGAATQCAHLISRRYHGRRWSSENAWCLCSRCHDRWTHDPLGWDDLMEASLGVVEWAKQKREAQPISKATAHQLSQMRLPLLLLVREQARKGMFGLDAQVEKIEARHARHSEEAMRGIVRTKG